MRILLPLCCVASTSVVAHPHIFIETAVTVVVDDAGAVLGVEVTWVYDDFFSLLLVEDLGLDPDGDMALQPAELRALEDAVLTWPEGFTGDVWVDGPGGDVALAPREDHRVMYDDGRVTEVHFRPLATPVSATEAVNVRVYDPGYYTAYSVTGPVELRGPEGCQIWMTPADLNAAYSLLDEMLYGRPASDVGADEEFPEVGASFADTVTVTCSVG